MGVLLVFSKDPWISKETSFKPILNMNSDMRVSEFIMPMICWDMAKLRRYVIPEDAELISYISLSATKRGM